MHRLRVVSLVAIFLVSMSVSLPVAAQGTGEVLVNGVRLDLDQTLTGSWNEIDAVELVGRTADGVVLRQWASEAEATSSFGLESWGATQATGAPDTLACGDYGTAWASSQPDGQDSLTLMYNTPVYPVEVIIYQTYNPGAIVALNLLAADSTTTLPAIAISDPATDCPEALTVTIATSDIQSAPISLDTLSMGVAIDLDQTLTGSWNEIDAVELVGLTEDGTLLHQWANTAEATSSYGVSNWGAIQATGAPDTPECGDHTTAWASAQSSGQDTLTLMYETPVYPIEVNIYQTYNPGAIIEVRAIPHVSDAPAAVIFSGADTTTECPGVLSISAPRGVQIGSSSHAMETKVEIDLDQTLTASWNEIDAVELVGVTEDGTLLRQWASAAKATSSYGHESWGAIQATGAPDTLECGDQTTAWASAQPNGQDTLTLTYETPVQPVEVNIYQTYNPGAIVTVRVISPLSDPEVITAFSGVDTTTACPGVLQIAVSTGAK